MKTSDLNPHHLICRLELVDLGTHKQVRALVPSDARSEEILRKKKPQADYLVEFRHTRNIRKHRLVFAVLGVMIERTDHYQTIDEALEALKWLTAHVKTEIIFDGTRHFEHTRTKSISFSEMSDDQFNDWMDRVFDCVAKIVRDDPQEVRRYIYEMIGG